MLFRFSICTALLFLSARASFADVTYNSSAAPGTPAEAALVLSGTNTIVDKLGRHAEVGGSWTYRIVLPPLCRCILRFTVEGDPKVTATGADGKPLPVRIDKAGTTYAVYATAPANHPMGGGLRFQFVAVTAPITVNDLRISIVQSDRNGDGLGDALEAMMGLTATQHAQVVPRPPRPKTSFQSGGSYLPAIGVPTDAVLAYTSDEAQIKSWIEKGYEVQTMGGFRAGPEYIKDHPGEVQTDGNGTPISIGGNSFYMVPTDARNEIAKQYYAAALAAGSLAVCPEEPEIFAAAGYSEAFKKEWLVRYGTPWERPDSSIEARYRAEQLKAFLTRRQIEAVLNDAQRLKPNAARMVAIHSPVTYYQWGITVPHYSLLNIPSLQEIIGQVWTGTARTPARTGGIRAERTFEVGYLEYSSLFNLARGSGKRMWFLMDPLEDNPNLPIEDYHKNYEQTLLAALMFPQIDSYEVMPWPGRIYEHVPPGYATLVNSVVGALCEMWRFPDGAVDAGSAGIGTFVSDSMGWQRAEPSPSDYDGFYALSLPLVNHGVPVQVLSLDRAAEPGYLSRQKTLLVSYDFLKPADATVNRALADWTQRGGTLLVFGGQDAYNDLKDSWWRKAGYSSPTEDLFTQMGVRVRSNGHIPNSLFAPPTPQMDTILSGDPKEHDLKNRRAYTVDLTKYAQSNGSVLVRFQDVSPQDGWGAYLMSAELRIGGRLAASFRTGSELETRFLAEEHNSRFSGSARFADRDGYWTYRFDNLPRSTPITLTLDMGNGFLVKAGSAPERSPLIETSDKSIERTVQKLRVPPTYPLTQFQSPDGASTLYAVSGSKAPIVWETRVGQGHVIYAGIPPGYFTSTAQSSRWLRALVKRGFEQAGGKYQEQTAFVTRRGPYVGVKSLGQEFSLDGRYVNMLSPTLAVEEDPTVPARGTAFYMNAGLPKGGPRLLAASGRVRARSERADTTAFFVQAPAGTEGVARIYKGSKSYAGGKAYTVFGTPVEVNAYPDGDTILLRYKNDPDGLVVRAGWK